MFYPLPFTPCPSWASFYASLAYTSESKKYKNLVLREPSTCNTSIPLPAQVVDTVDEAVEYILRREFES